MSGTVDTSPQGTARDVPAHAQTIVVPLSNPSTATDLLLLASMIAKPDHGRVIGLVVVLGDADAEAHLEQIEAFEEMVANVRARAGRLDMELLARPAASIARGILDVARDEGADMILLGVQAPTPGAVTIGALTTHVADTADCDVLIYRTGHGDQGLEGVDGVVVAVNQTEQSRVAARLGVLLAEQMAEGAELLHVLRPGETEAEGMALIDDIARGVDGAAESARRVVQAGDAAAGLKARIPRTKLAVIGFSTEPQGGERGLSTGTRMMLDNVRGPVLAISRPHRGIGAVALYRRAVTMLRPRLTEAEEQSLIWHARLNSTLSADFIVLSVVASVIATLGLLLNSAAVIIGAMLVAPLMSPLVAFGTALVDGEVRVLRRAATTVAVGSLLVAGTAILLGLLVRPDVPTPEMLSRGQPSLVDAGVAAASGIVGGYASARKGIPAALAGVAIAAALVPPICVFGLALSLDARLAVGSGLLFITNIACIGAASAGVLVWLGVRVRQSASRATYMRLTPPVLVGVLIAVVLFGLSAAAPDLRDVRAIVEDEVPSIEIVDVDTLGAGGTITITARATQPPPRARVDAAAERVAEATGGLQMRLVLQPLVPVGEPAD